MSSSDDTIDSIISYCFIEIGLLFSLLNIVIILANHETMMKNSYSRLMLLIQTLHLGACFIDNPFYGDNLDWCRVGGALFYLFWLSSNLFSEYLMLLVWLNLTGRTEKWMHFKRWIYIAITVFSAVVAFVPISTYEPVKIDDGTYQVYCGAAPMTMHDRNFNAYDAVVSLLYIVPVTLGLVLMILICIARGRILAKAKHSELTSEQRSALNIVFIPVVNIIFIFINAVLMLIEDKLNDHRHLYVFLTRLILLGPLINYLFFVKFATSLEEISEIEIVRLRWMFCIGKKAIVVDDSDAQQNMID